MIAAVVIAGLLTLWSGLLRLMGVTMVPTPTGIVIVWGYVQH